MREGDRDEEKQNREAVELTQIARDPDRDGVREEE
jgi:hypothetical protein